MGVVGGGGFHEVCVQDWLLAEVHCMKWHGMEVCRGAVLLHLHALPYVLDNIIILSIMLPSPEAVNGQAHMGRVV